MDFQSENSSERYCEVLAQEEGLFRGLINTNRLYFSLLISQGPWHFESCKSTRKKQYSLLQTEPKTAHSKKMQR